MELMEVFVLEEPRSADKGIIFTKLNLNKRKFDMFFKNFFEPNSAVKYDIFNIYHPNLISMKDFFQFHFAIFLLLAMNS